MCENREIRRKRAYRWYFVPLFKNTSISAPSNIFLPVPKGDTRIKWFELARRSDVTSLQNALYCYEDHFDECLENYRRVVEDKTASVRLKKGALPHKFDCRPDRERAFSKPVRPGVLKRQKRQILKEIEFDALSHKENIDSSRTVESQVSTGLAELKLPENEEPENITDNEATAFTYEFAHLISPSSSVLALTSPAQKYFSVQVRLLPKFRSKASSCVPITQDASCSPITIRTTVKLRKKQEALSTTSSNAYNLDDTLEDCSEYLPSDETSEEVVKQDDSIRRQEIKKKKLLLIANKEKMYVGIPDNSFFIIKLLHDATGLKIKYICLTLTKIRLDDTFARLGDEFGISSSNANTIFRRAIPLLVHFLQTLILWPSDDSIKLNLPLAFRARYSNVQSIIDCFVIEIQKPSNAIHQNVTWSEYKKCNTLKYLLSSTPDGTINFVSKGFGGRTTDNVIVQESKYLNQLPKNYAVMADRGFKHIEPLLRKNGCIVVRSPSVASSVKPTKAKVMERVIRRFREFALWKPHAGIHHVTLDIMDEIVIIAARLINLQSPIINQ